MTESKPHPVPKGLGPSGRRLWRSITCGYDLDQHEQIVLTEACRVTDRLQRLAEESDGAPLTVENHKGDQVANPMFSEARQQEIVLIRLLAALRLPTGDEETRPQRRGGARGAYRLYGVAN